MEADLRISRPQGLRPDPSGQQEVLIAHFTNENGCGTVILWGKAVEGKGVVWTSIIPSVHSTSVGKPTYIKNRIMV